MEYLVDIQGFKVDDFIVKEMAFVPVEEVVEPTVFLFKPPYPREHLTIKNPNRWVELNYHGLDWSSGDIPYYEMEKILQSIFRKSDVIYVKGLEKTKWMKKLLPRRCIYNIEDLGCPSLKKLSMEGVCRNHSLFLVAVCAKKNVKAIKNWLIEQRKNKIINF